MEKQNPLDLIRNLNAQKDTQKQSAEQAEIEKSTKNQEEIDKEHLSLEGQKKILVEDVENFKKKIEEIKGTREEMIAQYHEAIAEAKKNPETLAYVRDNFQEIFKEGKEKWQEIRNELNSVKELGENKMEALEGVETQIKDIFPETTTGKQKIEDDKRNQEYKKQEHARDIERQQEMVKTLEDNIENAKYQKQDYSDILGQMVEYTHEQYMNGEAKIISEDARKFTELWRQFPVHPFVISGRTSDVMVDDLQKKGYSGQDIEKYKEKRKQLDEIKERIENSLQKAKPRASHILFARSNDIKYPSFPFISIGHGNHYFDNSLSGKQMTLGELFDKEIEIKTKKLEEAKETLAKIEKEI